MASIQSIRTAIKNRLATINGLYVYEAIPDSILAPCAVVGMPASVAYDFAFRSAVVRMSIPIRLYVAPVLEDQAQDKLDGYVSADGAQSIRAAIDGDTTLAGTVHSVRVVSAQGYGAYDLGDIQYLGVEFSVEVVA